MQQCRVDALRKAREERMEEGKNQGREEKRKKAEAGIRLSYWVRCYCTMRGEQTHTN